MKKLQVLTCILLAFVLIAKTALADDPASFIRYQEPVLLNFEELKSVSKSRPAPGSQMDQKLNLIWKTPIIDNSAHFDGVPVKKVTDRRLGKVLRVASWNIEKSIELERTIKLLTAKENDFLGMLDLAQMPAGSKNLAEIKRQRNRLMTADILILQEMEIGIKRSGYRNAAADLAGALNMNYAFGTQYLEVDPVILGLKDVEYEDGDVDQEASEYFRVDPDKFKGVFGSAVLSKYPIKYAEVRPLKTQPYDWYEDEKKKISFMEIARRQGTKILFKNELTREIKAGGRHYFRVDLHIPELPNQTLTIINIHLEIKCLPKGREAQMKEILSYIKDIKNPVVMMGDFNSAPTDISPTTLKRISLRTATNPTTWLSLGLHLLTPEATTINVTRGFLGQAKNFNDPFATDIKVILPNPVKPMFKKIKRFKFSDSTTFDFRGNPKRSVNHSTKLLSNSNQRELKGFATTFSVKRSIGFLGKYRLDWAFVRSGLLYGANNDSGPYRLAPHYGETLEALNTHLRHPISDHHPNVIDLPINEPDLSSKRTS